MGAEKWYAVILSLNFSAPSRKIALKYSAHTWSNHADDTALAGSKKISQATKLK